jgi:hypothetical protein
MNRKQRMRLAQLEAEDVAQLLDWERKFAKCRLSHEPDGKPPVQILVHLWWKSRNLWERVLLDQPLGPERDHMAALIAERDRAMSRLQELAKDQLYAKAVEDEEKEMAK